MSDFIREVDEDYRRDRILKFLSRFQIPLIVLAVLIIAGAAGWRYWTDQKVTTAEKDNSRFTAAERLDKDGKTGEARAAFDAIASNGPAGYAMLARMRAAQILATQDREAAAKAFDAIASDDTIGSAIRDTARLRGAMIRIDTEEPKAFVQRYGRFASPGFAYRSSMSELLALASLKINDMETAGRYLDQIIIDPAAPSGLRNRAEAFRAIVTAGPATAATGPAPPASVTPLTPSPAPPASSPIAPPAADATPTPPPPTPAAPPAAAAMPTPAPALPAPAPSGPISTGTTPPP